MLLPQGVLACVDVPDAAGAFFPAVKLTLVCALSHLCCSS